MNRNTYWYQWDQSLSKQHLWLDDPFKLLIDGWWKCYTAVEAEEWLLDSLEAYCFQRFTNWLILPLSFCFQEISYFRAKDRNLLQFNTNIPVYAACYLIALSGQLLLSQPRAKVFIQAVAWHLAYCKFDWKEVGFWSTYIC